MRRYFYVYFLFLKYSFLEVTAFRMSFLNSVFSHLVWGGFQFISIFLLTSKTNMVFGWSREELFLLTAIFNLSIGIFRFFIAKNMDMFSRVINLGTLDQYLLKPLDSQFLLSLRHANIGATVRIPLSILVILYILNLLEIHTDLFTYITFNILLVFGLLIIYSVWFMVMTLRIWFTNLFNLRDLLGNISGISRYPKEMFENTAVYLLLLFLPLTLAVSVPTKYLLGRATNSEIVLLIIVSVVLFKFTRLFWNFALRYYTSASG